MSYSRNSIQSVEHYFSPDVGEVQFRVRAFDTFGRPCGGATLTAMPGRRTVQAELNWLDLDPRGSYRLEIWAGSELVKEQVLLAVPMKPLCISECRGICSECGINLNEEVCNCGTEKIDPRLAPLKHFMKPNND